MISIWLLVYFCNIGGIDTTVTIGVYATEQECEKIEVRANTKAAECIGIKFMPGKVDKNYDVKEWF